MEVFTYETEAVDEGMRLDKYLADKMTGVTRSFLQKLIKDGRVLTDGCSRKSNYKLKAAQKVEVSIPPAEDVEILPENIPLDILYEDDDLLVINKPKNMVVHPSAGHFSGTLVNAVMYHCKDSLSGINGAIRPGIVHRIDKDTTGSLIICASRNKSRRIPFREFIAELLPVIRKNLMDVSKATLEGIRMTGKKWPLSHRMANLPSRIIRRWNSGRMRHIWNFGWRPEERIKFVCIWRISVTLCWETLFTEARKTRII